MAGLLLVAVGLPVVVLGAGLGLMPEHLRGAMSSDGVTSLDSFLANLTGYALFAGLVAAVQMARMEIARRTAFLGLRPRWWQMGLGWGALALCFAAVAAYLLYVRKPAPEGDFSAALTKDAAIAFAALPLLWLMAKHAIGLFRRGSTLRHRLLARRLIAPVLMMALLQLAGLAVLHGMERRIIAHDPAHLWSRLAPGPARSSRRRWTGFRQSGRGDGTGAARGISRAAPLRFPFSGAMGLHVEQAPRT
jgi:hypothetical protein